MEVVGIILLLIFAFVFLGLLGWGTESIGMGIRVPPGGLLHQFRLPLLGLSGNCPLVRYDNDVRMRRKEKTL
jgi:hypothetical protein